MDECGAYAGTQSALRDGLSFDEYAKLIVGRLGGTRLVVAEQLPFRSRFEVGFCLELWPVGKRGAFGEGAVHKLLAGALHAHLMCGDGIEIEWHRLAIDDVVLTHPANM
jgi:hypothetical protein